MNQLYRALHMPPSRLLRKLSGEKEIYTIAVRPRPQAEGCSPLPALGGTAYTPLPYTPGVWYADPLLFHWDGKRYLFCEAFEDKTGRGAIAVTELQDDGRMEQPHVVLREEFHLSFPTVFAWQDEIWMLPETSADHAINLYRCVEFPDRWERAKRFPVRQEICDIILTDKQRMGLALLCSETKPENGLYTRYRRYELVRDEDPMEEDPPEFQLLEDEPFNLQHRVYDLGSRNAGPLFFRNERWVHPTQVSTTVDYGVYLQFFEQRGASEVPLCAATPQNVRITGILSGDLIGIHSYCCDDQLEVIDARYLRRVEKGSSSC